MSNNQCHKSVNMFKSQSIQRKLNTAILFNNQNWRTLKFSFTCSRCINVPITCSKFSILTNTMFCKHGTVSCSAAVTLRFCATLMQANLRKPFLGYFLCLSLGYLRCFWPVVAPVQFITDIMPAFILMPKFAHGAVVWKDYNSLPLIGSYLYVKAVPSASSNGWDNF